MSDHIVEQIIEMRKRLAAEREGRAAMAAERDALTKRAAQATTDLKKERPTLGRDEIKKRLKGS